MTAEKRLKRINRYLREATLRLKEVELSLSAAAEVSASATRSIRDLIEDLKEECDELN